jgi:polyhydroxyalkanoate synthesis regulator phasin
MNKKVTAVGLTAGLLAGAGAGLILEMSGSAGATSQPAAVVEPNDDQPVAGSDTTGERPDPTERLQEVLQPLVDDGTITQAQADAVIDALQAAAPQGGPGGPGRPGPKGPGFAVVAETLGLTEEEVRQAVIDGQTLAELAAANGSSAEELVDAILADIKSHMDEKVAAGDLTQEEADAKLAEAEERVAEFVNNTKPPIGPGGQGGPGRPGGPGGPGGGVDAPADAPADGS